VSRPLVHLFFNGDECFFPPGAAWEKFRGLDAARTFLICAESWRRNGWDVARLSTLERDSFIPTPFLADGECSRSWHWYPEPFWQFIAKAKAIARVEPSAWHWFGTIDVINFGFKEPFPPQDEATCRRIHECGCASYQREHFSMSLICCRLDWLEEAERLLIAYDQRKLASLNREYTSDETILRVYARAVLVPLMTFANNTEKDGFPLCHFSRSAVPFAYGAVAQS